LPDVHRKGTVGRLSGRLSVRVYEISLNNFNDELC